MPVLSVIEVETNVAVKVIVTIDLNGVAAPEAERVIADALKKGLDNLFAELAAGAKDKA
jgi:hypothetical protein